MRLNGIKGLLKKGLDAIRANYNGLLKAHKALHTSIYNRVRIDLGATPQERSLSKRRAVGEAKEYRPACTGFVGAYL